MIASARRRLAGFFGYQAAELSKNRKSPGARIRSADDLLNDTRRRRLTENARDLQRNYSTFAWMVRKHLDYVSTFTFQARTPDEAFNERLEDWLRRWSRPETCDIGARHPLPRLIRLAEMRRVIDGDLFLLKLRSGHLQAIEGDRVKNPDRAAAAGQTWTHGIRTGPGGRLAEIAVHARTPHGTYDFERFIPARNVFHLGYWETFDQVRGVSPLAASIDLFRDVLEVSEYARLKSKITQLFALIFTQEASDPALDETDQDDPQENDPKPPYAARLSDSPVTMTLDPGDKAEFLESKHPSTEFQAFLEASLMAGLRALDIPFSFYREDFTNFFGSRSALIHYQQSCQAKRRDLVELLDHLTAWRFQLALTTGDLSLPAGLQPADLRWEWIHAGTPWWDPAKEIRGDALAIQQTLRTRAEIRRERYGDDWRDVARRLADENAYLAELGLPLQTGPDAEPEPADDEAPT